MEQLTVCTSTNFVNYSGLKINKDSSWYVFAGSRLTEECVEGVITTTNGLVTGHLSIRLDTVLQTVQLPAGVAHLDTSLANVDTDTFTHYEDSSRDYQLRGGMKAQKIPT
jgi:hypothetical protein